MTVLFSVLYCPLFYSVVMKASGWDTMDIFCIMH